MKEWKVEDLAEAERKLLKFFKSKSQKNKKDLKKEIRKFLKVKDKNGENILFFAVRSLNLFLVKKILAFDSNIFDKNKKGENLVCVALTTAMFKERHEINTAKAIFREILAKRRKFADMENVYKLALKDLENASNTG